MAWDPGNPRRLAVSDDGERIAIATGAKLVVLDRSLKVVREIPAHVFDETLAIADDGTIALGHEDGRIEVFDGGSGARAFTLFVPRTKPGAAVAVADDGRHRILGDVPLARRYLSCRFGTRAVPIDVCEGALEDPTVLAGARR